MNTVPTTAVVSLSAALALLIVKFLEKGCDLHSNGETPMCIAAITVVVHAVLNYAGITDVGK